MKNEKSAEIFNDFQEEIELLNNEMRDVDNLYNDLSSHFQNIKSSQFRGSLVFVQNQARNLIELKSLKMNLIKERSNIKKAAYDISFKNEKNIDEAANNAELVNSIMNELRKNMNTSIERTDDYDEHNNDEMDLDAMTAELDDDPAVKYSKTENVDTSENIIQTDGENNIYYCLTDKCFYELSSSYEIINELGPDYAKVISLYDMDGGKVAYCEDSKFYNTIEFEEE